MKKVLKMAIILNMFSLSFLNAFDFSKFSTNSWNWIIVAILFLLFLIIAISIIKDLKKKKNKINEDLIEEKRKNIDSANYLFDINLETLKSSKELDKAIENLNYSKNDKKIIKKLSKLQKDIFQNAQEESIFLHIATNKDFGKEEPFLLKDMIAQLERLGILKNATIIIKNDVPYSIVANKELIQSIIFLLTKLQLKENNLPEAVIEVSVDKNTKELKISIPDKLELNSFTQNVLQNNFEPIYNSKEKKYYGVYLYLINKLLARVGGILSINKEDNSYSVKAVMPIELNKDNIAINYNVNKKLKEPKSALIITKEPNLANIISRYLEEYNFNVDIELSETLNNEIPNFLNYQLVLMDAELYEPILSNYILSVKKYIDLKIVSLEENGKIYEYPLNLIDATINRAFVEKEINEVVHKLFSNELIDINSTIDNKESKELEDKVLITPPQKRDKSTLKVLIADDDRINRHILEYMLKQYNLEVCSAKDGEEALEILEQNECNLIILDSIMPKMDGFETIKHIRANKKYNSTPVIIHTSFSLGNNTIENIFKLGFDSYLPKPFNKHELKALLERYVELDEIKDDSNDIKIENNSDYKENVQEFLAIYGDSDKLIERYIKEQRAQQALDLIVDLKEVSYKIGAKKFIESLKRVEKELKATNNVDNNLIYALSNDLADLKNRIYKKISA